MSVHVTTHMKTRAEHTNQVIDTLRQAVPHSLQRQTGMTDEIDALLTEPLIIKYFDDLVSITR